MDEENNVTIQRQRLAVGAPSDLFWGDFYFLIGEVIRVISPWIWSDYGWHHPDLFFKHMPKSVVQSNWYYGLFDLNSIKDNSRKDLAKIRIKFINDLEAKEYDQIPTGSNYSYPENFGQTVIIAQKGKSSRF
jgi:hypothetical protein